MGAQLNFATIIKAIALGTISTVLASVAHGQQLNLTSNQFTVSVPSTTFSSTVSVANTGTVGAVTGVPTTGSLTTPSFSFTLQGTAINGTSGTYTVGIILDEQGSQRRLEIYIPGVSLSFDGGGNLTGSLTTPNVTIYGRDSAGTLTAEVTAANGGSVSFNGNSISFSAADQISFIQAQGGILADITTSINNTGLTYDYTLILANTAGTNYAFEHSDGTDFPATGASEFTLVPASNADENTALATNGQKLTGTVAFAAASSGGGGGGSSVTAGEVSTSLTSAFSFVGSASSETGGSFSTQGLLTAAQKSIFKGGIKGMLKSLRSQISSSSPLLSALPLLGPGSSAADGASTILGNETLESDRELLLSIGASISAVAEIGEVIDNELLVDAQNFSDDLLQQRLSQIAEVVNPALNVTYTNSTATRQLLAGNPALLAGVIDVVGIPLTSTLQPDQSGIQANLVTAGLDSTNAQTLAANLTAFVDPSGVTVTDSNDQLVTAASSLQNNTGASTVVSYNAATLNSSVFDGGSSQRFPINVLDIRIVPASVPTGLRALPDGSIVSVNTGLATTVAPAPVDTIALARGINSAGATMTIESDGAVTLAGSGFTVSATFGFDGVSTIASTTETPTFSEPTGDPASAGYYFTITYGNAVSQNILPYLQDDLILDTIIAAGLDVVTDRSTGVFTIAGAGSFRPGYFVEAATLEDSNFRSQAGNPDVAFRPVDANGDGVTDYRAIVGTNVQMIYGMP
ncbi:unnamed protein product [Symbiodinium microadriaticum]|nr:unnamed protein product [Symbiodinium microadriaticum]